MTDSAAVEAVDVAKAELMQRIGQSTNFRPITEVDVEARAVVATQRSNVLS